jgi:hypothetical protein
VARPPQHLQRRGYLNRVLDQRSRQQNFCACHPAHDRVPMRVLPCGDATYAAALFDEGQHCLAIVPRGVRKVTERLLRSLLRHVDRIEITSEPELAVNNVIRRFEILPLRLVPLAT